MRQMLCWCSTSGTPHVLGNAWVSPREKLQIMFLGKHMKETPGRGTENDTFQRSSHQELPVAAFSNSGLILLAKLLQSCLPLCDPMDCNPPGSSLHGILQARILELVAISFCKGSSWHRDQIHISCVSCTAGGFLTTWAIRETHSPPLPFQLILDCMKLQKTLDCILLVSHQLCLGNFYISFLTLSSIPYCRTAPSLPSQFQYQQTSAYVSKYHSTSCLTFKWTICKLFQRRHCGVRIVFLQYNTVSST